MNYLIRKNIIKKTKVIVSVEKQRIEVLGIRYAGGKVNVTGSCTLDTGFDAYEIANAIRSSKNIKNGDIVLSIPSSHVQYRIQSAKNIKMPELDKHIRANNPLSRVSEQSHIIDWTYLGEREEKGDTLRYYLVAAINKSVVSDVIDEFRKQRLNLTEITFAENSMVCLADLWHDDYAHISKLYIDYNEGNSRILVESGGAVVYSRVINASNHEFPSELLRIIRMCGNDGIDISKIICFNEVPDGLFDDFAESGIAVDLSDCSTWYELGGNGYELSLSKANVEKGFALTIGAGLSAMQSGRRLNLMPAEDKEKQVGKFLKYTFGSIVAILALVLVLSYVNLGFANLTLNKLRAKDLVDSKKMVRITELEESNKNNEDFIEEYKIANFPFYTFMQFIERNKPYGLTIISVDSADRLTQNAEVPKVAKDLTGEKISIRGYSKDPKDISAFLYDLSKLPYIADLELKAIEENTLGGENINLFEAILEVQHE